MKAIFFEYEFVLCVWLVIEIARQSFDSFRRWRANNRIIQRRLTEWRVS